MINQDHPTLRWPGASNLARLACLVLTLALSPARAADVLVFAAASLKPALDTILETPEAQALGEISVSYAATSQLARQIEHAAPASLFISADPEWMDHVEREGRIVRGTRSDLLGNALVLVAAQSSSLELEIAPGFNLLGALGKDGRLAMGEPDSVPAGRYARAALASLGVWAGIEPRIVPALHVRAALNFVVRHEAPLGIVYRSDAVSEPRVRVIGTFASSTHPPIVYPVALLTGGDNDASRRLLALLHSARAAAIFTRFGFRTTLIGPSFQRQSTAERLVRLGASQQPNDWSSSSCFYPGRSRAELDPSLTSRSAVEHRWDDEQRLDQRCMNVPAS